MAHPCSICGGECYCNGDIDDCIVSKTPKGCNSCGCLEDEERDDNLDDDYEFFNCVKCEDPFTCEANGICKKTIIKKQPMTKDKDKLPEEIIKKIRDDVDREYPGVSEAIQWWRIFEIESRTKKALKEYNGQ